MTVTLLLESGHHRLGIILWSVYDCSNVIAIWSPSVGDDIMECIRQSHCCWNLVSISLG